MIALKGSGLRRCLRLLSLFLSFGGPNGTPLGLCLGPIVYFLHLSQMLGATKCGRDLALRNVAVPVHT